MTVATKTLLLLTIFSVRLFPQQSSWIRVNQLGYLPGDVKTAVFAAKEVAEISSFDVFSAFSGERVLHSRDVEPYGAYGAFASTYRLNFSAVRETGLYYIEAGGTRSPEIKIHPRAYDGTADFLLKYMRQQRCGYNPYLKDSCHTHDGFIIYHPEKDSQHLDARGGWHDASDYLQYVTTSANAVYQMLFAYQQHPESFGDAFDKDGNPGANGIPDVLDEAKWGLDWLSRMNPAPGEFYNQIADDRDHRGFRLPTEDTVYYGKGRERPVYFVNGKPQGVYQYKNRTEGVASTAGKYASSFALGSKLLEKYYPAFAKEILQKAFDAYEFGKRFPGVCQTAPCRAPYFYEEDNWTDDMELAAIQLFTQTKAPGYLHDAVSLSKKEPVTPWMGADTARHYQWYPFLNLGHYLLAKHMKPQSNRQFIHFLRRGLEAIQKRSENPFRFGVPFIWCSNNLVAAAITQARLYYSLTGDSAFRPMEYALRDWLFGCNPWGTSMIFGLPSDGDTPADPHSAFTHHYGYPVDGGLIDGPVYTAIFKRLLGIHLSKEDAYKEFQSDIAVYHDDWGDYSTNEPTMDGTASLSYYFAAMQAEGAKAESTKQKEKFVNAVMERGGVTRMDTAKKIIYLVFTGHEFANGGETILRALKKHGVPGSFFFTGDFYREKKFETLIRKIKKAGHYLGAHSDKHLLYCDWSKRDSTLITKQGFLTDLYNNYKEMERFGIAFKDAPYFLPPYEWYNGEISAWCGQIGIRLVNMTPGLATNADYTFPSMGREYRSSDDIEKALFAAELNGARGLNGAILLVHAGANPEREDVFYVRLHSILRQLKKKGYSFARF